MDTNKRSTHWLPCWLLRRFANPSLYELDVDSETMHPTTSAEARAGPELWEWARGRNRSHSDSGRSASVVSHRCTLPCFSAEEGCPTPRSTILPIQLVMDAKLAWIRDRRQSRAVTAAFERRSGIYDQFRRGGDH